MKPVFAGLAALALALLVSCGSPSASHSGPRNGGGHSSSTPVAKPSSSPEPAPTTQSQTPTPAPRATSAPVTPAPPTPTPAQVQSSVCGTSGTTVSVQGNLTFNGAPYVLQIQMADYHGPGAYSIPPERVSLQSPNPSPTSPLRPALTGTVTVSSTGQGGTVDAELGPAGQPPLMLNAAWACS